MALVNWGTSTPAPAASAATRRNVTTRGDVKFGQLFRVKGQKATRAAIGKNGKLFSVNIGTGALSSSSHADTEVDIVGNFGIRIEHAGKVLRKVKRKNLSLGDLFVSNGKLYVNVGAASRGERKRWISIVVGSMDEGSTTNGERTVKVVGSAKLNTTP